MSKEFDIIARYFTRPSHDANRVRLGIGDDCALVDIPSGQTLALSMDTLVAGVHFPVDTHPFDIGYKVAAVNLSDLAAMGAKPVWATLALSLPEADETWLEAFSAGLFTLFDEHQVSLIGGDTTQGPLSITVQIHGWLEETKALTRSNARPGDSIFVTGSLGDAGLGLLIAKDELECLEEEGLYLLSRLNQPTPRVEAGLQLAGLAHAAIDISDGLLADLGHMINASGVGAVVNVDALPLSPSYRALQPIMDDPYKLALSAGDDYELCFTLAKADEAEMRKRMNAIECSVSCIGEVLAGDAIHLQDKNRQDYKLPNRMLENNGYQHFSEKL